MEEDSPDLIDFNFRFNAALEELLEQKAQNTQMFSKVAYEAMIHKVKESKAKVSNKKPEDYQRVKRFDILNVGGQERLITRPGSGHILYYVNAEEVFQILHEFHEETKHGGRESMSKVVSGRYKNITREMIMLFIKLCPTCTRTQRALKFSCPNKFNNIWSMCVLNIIDLSGKWADHPYEYVLAYQECATKFIVLKPIKKKCIEEVADNLIDIFTLFGAPKKMWVNKSDLDKDFIKKSLQIIFETWPTIDTYARLQSETIIQLYGETLQTYIKGFVRQEKNRNWSKQIRFLQFQLNNKHKLNPFTAMFGKQELTNTSQENQNVVSTSIVPKEKEPTQTVIEMRNVQNTLVVTCTEDDEPISYTEILEVFEGGSNTLTETHDNNISLPYTIKEEIDDQLDEENTIRSYTEVQSTINTFQEKVDKVEELYEEETENTCTEDDKPVSNSTNMEEFFERGSDSAVETHDDIISLPYIIKEEIDDKIGEESTTEKRSHSEIQNVINIGQERADIDALRRLEKTKQEESYEEKYIDFVSVEVRKKPRL